MLKSYFFIPANRVDFINKIDRIKADYLIFDLEDSINDSIYYECVENLRSFKKRSNYFIRTKFFENKRFISKNIDDSIKLGFFNFVIPKLDEISQIVEIEEFMVKNFKNDFEKYSFILLVESPKALMFLKEILLKTKLNIVALALGSHDYCRNIGMKHNLENLDFARQFVLNIARAFNLVAIDIASMQVSKLQYFEKEAMSAFEMGYEAKFILHPEQLKVLKNLVYYNKLEIKEAKEVLKIVEETNVEKFTVIKVGPKLYEKPHLKRFSDIIEWSENNGKQ